MKTTKPLPESLKWDEFFLCTCNNCETIFLDQNPQTNAKAFKVNLLNTNSLSYLKDSTPKQDIDGGEYFWGCGICETDDFLTDEVDEVKAKKLGII